MTTPSTVAVIDIGSNSIKLLVAARDGGASVREITQRTEETRLGTGITGNPPRLAADAMARALESVRTLLALAHPHAPAQVRIVATSAVRDAANGGEFAERIAQGTGHALHVLPGAEEARLIGRGIMCDPTVRGQPAFYLFDLGGGSLEMLACRAGQVEQLASLPLGCVRLTESCVNDPALPLSPAEADRIRNHVAATVAAANFHFLLPAGTMAVVTGGTATTVRTMRAAIRGIELQDDSPLLTITELEQFAARLCAAPLTERRCMPGLPPKRADVMPAAIVTLIEVARLAGVDAFRHSFYNLRYGLAAELLGIVG